MSQQWILEEVLKTDEYNAEQPDTLNAVTIDTTTDDHWHHNMARTVERKIAAVHDGADTNWQGHLTFDGPRIVPEQVPDAWLAESLTAPPSVRRLCSDQNLRSWWMDENQEPLSTVNARGFGGGVQRRRSVSKALYHIADHVEESVAPRVDNDDEVAVVAALGGGTGSGMALDIAEDLDCQRAHLYAVIPHDGDQENEKTNAHAALSELEYLQLTGDNPFSTITILPYVEDLDDREFEMAVVRTILAHQNDVQQGCSGDNIIPGGSTGPPEFSAFTLAVPYTVQYDIEARTEAEDEIQSTLAAKQHELKREADLYEVVETYLEESFSDSAGAVLDGGVGPQFPPDTMNQNELFRLRERIENDLFEKFLRQPAFDIGHLDDMVADIESCFRRVYEMVLPQGDVEETEASIQFVEKVPDALRSEMEQIVHTESGRGRELVETITLELENVARRHDLWSAIAHITSEESNLTSADAELIRTALQKGILDHDTHMLREVILNPTLEERIADLRDRRVHLREKRAELKEFHATVAEDLYAHATGWREDMWESAAVIAAINDHRKASLDAIATLEDEIRRCCQAVERAETAEEVSAISLELDHVVSLNRRLHEMDVEPINVDDIAVGFEHIKQARMAQIEHGTGLVGIRGSDRTPEFNDAVAGAAASGWFEIHGDIEDTFGWSFDGERLDRQAEITERNEKAIKHLINAFEDRFLMRGSSLRYTLDTGGDEPVVLPQDVDATSMRGALRSALGTSRAETVEELFSEVLPLSWLDPNEPATELPATGPGSVVCRKLFESYLRPIGEEHARVVDELEELIDKEQGHVGLIDRLERLQGLSNPETANVELPEANPRDRGGETYGRDFAREYDGIYEIELEREIETQTDDHPYLEHRTADPADLVGAPEDIDDSDVLDNHEENIVREFERSVNRMFGDDVRVPLKTLEPRGTTEHDDVSPEYERLRFRPVYMSRAFDHEVDNIDQKYQSVRRELRNNRRSLQQNSLYKAESYDSGGPDEMTMVMFIGGVFLDNISLLTTLDGYKDQYEIRYGEYDFIGAHHSVGLGKMEKWETLSEWINDDADDQGLTGDVGGYVYRDRLRDVTDGEFIDDLMVAATGDGDPADILLEMYECEAYESTVPLSGG